MTHERLTNLANELLVRFNLPLYQIRKYKIEQWEKQFYADRMNLTMSEFSEVLCFIKSSDYQPTNKATLKLSVNG